MKGKSMGTKEKLHVAIQEDMLDEADQILKEFALRWFMFGLGVGIVVASLFYGFVLTNHQIKL